MISFCVRPLLAAAAVALVAPVSAQTPTGKDLPPIEPVSSVRRPSPVYPLDHLLKGKTGWAEVRFMVDYAGNPTMPAVAGTNDPAFGAALLADVESNEFMPPRMNGQPQIALSSVRYEFSGEASLEPADKRVLAELKKPKPAIPTAQELDAPLKASRQEAPVYPYAQESDGISGKAEIEFIVDRDGRAVLPRVVSSSSDDFGWAAATAISLWRYAPPMKGGQKTDARVNLVFKFDHTTGKVTW